jgi:hypothetical protein
MPAVPAAIGENSGAALIMITAPIGNLPTFSASGIDRGVIFNGAINLRTVAVQ